MPTGQKTYKITTRENERGKTVSNECYNRYGVQRACGVSATQPCKASVPRSLIFSSALQQPSK